jgi:hypothetical protein
MESAGMVVLANFRPIRADLALRWPASLETSAICGQLQACNSFDSSERDVSFL